MLRDPLPGAGEGCFCPAASEQHIRGVVCFFAVLASGAISILWADPHVIDAPNSYESTITLFSWRTLISSGNITTAMIVIFPALVAPASFPPPPLDGLPGLLLFPGRGRLSLWESIEAAAAAAAA